jgi:hypothetical protein
VSLAQCVVDVAVRQAVSHMHTFPRRPAVRSPKASLADAAINQPVRAACPRKNNTGTGRRLLRSTALTAVAEAREPATIDSPPMLTSLIVTVLLSRIKMMNFDVMEVAAIACVCHCHASL